MNMTRYTNTTKLNSERSKNNIRSSAVNRSERVSTKKDFFDTNKTQPNYKDVLILRRFLNDRFQILPTSKSGLTSKNQRRLAQEIKKARFIGLLPYTDLHSQL
jgi:small subunit ribosomal protein S18